MKIRYPLHIEECRYPFSIYDLHYALTERDWLWGQEEKRFGMLTRVVVEKHIHEECEEECVYVVDLVVEYES